MSCHCLSIVCCFKQEAAYGMRIGDWSSDVCSSDLGAALSDISMIGRRGPIEASFTSAELAELGRLENLRPVVAKVDLPDNIPAGLDPAEARVKEKNLSLLHEFAARDDEKPVKLHFVFHRAPEAELGSGRVEALKLRSEEHTSELQSLMRISYDDLCLKKKKRTQIQTKIH